MKAKKLFRVYILVLSVIVLLGIASAQDQPPGWVSSQRGQAVETGVLEDRIHTKHATLLINWRYGYIEAEGRATANPAEFETIAQCRLMAEGAAVTNARLALTMQVKDMLIAGGFTVENMAARGQIAWDKLNKTVMKNILILEPGRVVSYEADRSPIAQAKVGYLIHGPNSLAAQIFDTVKKHYSGEPASGRVPPSASTATSAETISGLIIDATGLSGRPCMSPKIIVEGSGRALYGPASMSRNEAIIKGTVGYANSVANAMNLKRIGGNPMVVRAVKMSGKSDCLVSKADSVRIFSADTYNDFLKKGHVVIVLN